MQKTKYILFYIIFNSGGIEVLSAPPKNLHTRNNHTVSKLLNSVNLIYKIFWKFSGIGFLIWICIELRDGRGVRLSWKPLSHDLISTTAEPHSYSSRSCIAINYESLIFTMEIVNLSDKTNTLKKIENVFMDGILANYIVASYYTECSPLPDFNSQRF
jgi:hypothetical protein